MVTALAVWSLVLIPGEPEAFIPPCDIKITNVALGDELEDETGRTTVKLTYRHPSPESDSESDDEDKDEESDDENEPITTVLCSLTPGKIEQAVIDLILESEQEVLFETVGKNPIYLTGNFIDQEQAPPYDEEPDSDEEGYRLEDVSSDVEIGSDEMDIPNDEDDSHRFEEVSEEVERVKPSKDSKKRPRESDVADADEGKPSKAEKKKANKKLKADESGKAVPTAKDETPAEAKVNNEDKKKDKKKKDKKGKDGETKQDGKGETKVLAGGLKVQDHKVGTGPQAKKGDTVGVRYVGKLDNGKVFDSNTKGKPFTFHLGKGEVIKGWDEGVAGMQVGGERLLTVPPALAYGNKKMSDIPAGSTLTFEVKLVNIH